MAYFILKGCQNWF